MNGQPSPRERLRALGAAATIGTDRFASGQTSADGLLTDAATLGLQARAGWRPAIHTHRLPACPRDDRPIAPVAACSTLIGLLGDPDPAIIEEWAALALAHGVIVDPATVPILLDWWVRQPRRSESVFAALGERGKWLVSLNADWQEQAALPEIPADVDDQWQLGRIAERVAVLTSVRRKEPARALALVESTWRTDAASDRQRFLEVLLANRSMADEPFLEAALDDKSKVVRRQASAVLASIPGSRLRQRMSEAARTIVSIRTTRGTLPGRSRNQIVLMPPDLFAASWERDGLTEAAPKGIGHRAWWMQQILAIADLAVWTERTDLMPDAILDSLKDGDYFGDALQALIAAATSSGDAAWSTALVRCLLDRMPIDLDSIAVLLKGLPDERRESMTLEIAEISNLSAVNRWAVLTSLDHRWSSAFSMEAMKLLNEPLTAPVDDRWPLIRAVEIASRRVSPDAIAAFEETVTRAFAGTLPESATRSVERVRLRADMHKEFTS
jgi:Family of unknown function (DUF5691)